jgi:curved DNA-binding protein CbpA
MTDHYELLGVESDASKDEIKAAYRAEVADADSSRRAQLNRAWNVLSDPVQRERYDEQRVAQVGDQDDESGTEVAVVGARSRATGARRGPVSTTVEAESVSTNGSGKNGAAGRGSKAPPPPPKVPTIELPEGLVQAPTRARSYAMALDFSVLVVIFILVYWIGGTVIKNQYPAETHRIDRLSDQSTAADKAKSKADDAKGKANDALDKAKKGGSSATVSAAQDKADAATSKAKAADKESKQVADDLTKAQSKLRTPYLLVYLAILVLSLLYCVPMSVRTGQTFGKRLRRVRLVRIDGSPPGWTSSLIHYGLPIFLTLALVQVLGPLAIILGLGVVLWNLRDRNRQGVHDKLAKTFVVEA